MLYISKLNFILFLKKQNGIPISAYYSGYVVANNKNIFLISFTSKLEQTCLFISLLLLLSFVYNFVITSVSSCKNNQHKL